MLSWKRRLKWVQEVHVAVLVTIDCLSSLECGGRCLVACISSLYNLAAVT